MTANDLPTVGYLDHWFRVLLAHQQAAPAAAPAQVVLYSIQDLAEHLSVTPNTVRRWLKTGKPSRDPKLAHDPDHNVKLQAFYFTSEARIPWPALLAYERGEPFDLATLP
ncbi:helix-turn-helix domain-containing protein, partial [Hymenobacter agri]